MRKQPIFCSFVVFLIPLVCCGVAQLNGQDFPAAGSKDSITVTVSPTSTSLGVGANQQFSATVKDSSDQSVQWEVNGVAGGNSQVGTIDNSGLYIAPATVPSGLVTVTAIAEANTTASGSASVSLFLTDPLGTVRNSAIIKCPSGGLSDATCYSLDVECPGIADFTTYLKVNSPPATSLGTVIFGVGLGGSNLYELNFTYGSLAVQSVLDAGFVTAQISFGAPFTSETPNGWMTGPGGVRRLACRYATAAQWIYNNIHHAKPSTPMCATGSSAGSAAITYALAEYGEGNILSMVEPTSGPPMARLDYGCICTLPPQATPCGQGQLSLCYTQEDAEFIDSAYSTPLCSTATSANSAQLLSDSVLAQGLTRDYPETFAHIVFGGQDNSAAVPQGLQWFNSVTSSKGGPVCVSDAPHEIPDVRDGALQIASDLINNCRLQP